MKSIPDHCHSSKHPIGSILNIAVCDDEILFVKQLEPVIARQMKLYHQPFRIFCYTNARELLAAPHKFSILFLDIRMPGPDGIELGKKIRERDITSVIIFITALREKVFDALETEPLDYLIKPVDEEHLKKTLRRALKRVSYHHDKRLLIQTAKQYQLVPLDTIYYGEVLNRKIYLHTAGGLIDYYCRMEDLEEQLDSRFVKCHRSYIVNLDYVKEYAEGQLRLENGDFVPVSRLRRQDFKQALFKYLQKELY